MIDGYVAVFIFLLAAFTGYEVISRVPVILHTPLMSGSNFVHGIVVVGAMVALGVADTTPERIIGFAAVLLGAANAVGGYAVTERMLEMFRSSDERRAAGGGEQGGAQGGDAQGDGGHGGAEQKAAGPKAAELKDAGPKAGRDAH